MKAKAERRARHRRRKTIETADMHIHTPLPTHSTYDTLSQALQASQAYSRTLDLGTSPCNRSFPADRVPWGEKMPQR